jgi:Immunity protein 7
VEFLRGVLDEAADEPGLRDLRWVNGSPLCHFGGFSNHRNSTFDDLLAGVRGVAKRAPGSYGLVYYWDDEDPEHRSGFRVLVIRRGQLTEEADPFLSPAVPMIEDPQPPEEDW